MIVRQYNDHDLDAILDLHRRQGLDYELPPIKDMAVTCLIEEGDNITHALLLRPTLEAFWLFDQTREWKRQSLGRLLILHKEGDIAAARKGFTDVHCWIPPHVLNPKMDRTMTTLGWSRPLWPCFQRPVVSQLVEA